jgi:hypothetical protein
MPEVFVSSHKWPFVTCIHDEDKMSEWNPVDVPYRHLMSRVSQNLSSAARKVAVRKLDIQSMVHIWDGKEDIGWRRVGGGLFHRMSRGEAAEEAMDSEIMMIGKKKKIGDVSL